MGTENEFSILDKGYVKIIDKWGSDEQIVRAARMSTNKGFLGWAADMPCLFEYGVLRNCEMGTIGCVQKHSGDERLLKYLYDNRHETPFEMAGLIVEVKAPIMVFREWHRHRSQSYNEMSARYTPLPDENYVPSVERLMMNANTSNKQAARAHPELGPFTERDAERFRTALEMQYNEAEEVYQASLRSGVPKELARLVIPVGRYSKMWASANLRNWLAFLTLRMDSRAQWEIREYANAVGRFISEVFPRTWELFQIGRSK